MSRTEIRGAGIPVTLSAILEAAQHADPERIAEDVEVFVKLDHRARPGERVYWPVAVATDDETGSLDLIVTDGDAAQFPALSSLSGPYYTLTLELGGGNSTPDDIADALESAAKTMRGWSPGPMQGNSGGNIVANGSHVGDWRCEA